jgi:hypothetical protein
MLWLVTSHSDYDATLTELDRVKMDVDSKKVGEKFLHRPPSGTQCIATKWTQLTRPDFGPWGPHVGSNQFYEVHYTWLDLFLYPEGQTDPFELKNGPKNWANKLGQILGHKIGPKNYDTNHMRRSNRTGLL